MALLFVGLCAVYEFVLRHYAFEHNFWREFLLGTTALFVLFRLLDSVETKDDICT